jgi:hypothetical protein
MRRHRDESPAPSKSQPEAADLEASSLTDLTSQPAWDPFLPETSEQKDEKQPNEPNNSLQTKQPPKANPTHEAHSRSDQAGTNRPIPGHSDFWLPTSSTPPSCKIDGSCHPLNPQDSR